MKFAKLIGKAEKLVDELEQGEEVKPAKLTRLQELLNDKIAHYEARLGEDLDPDKRKKLETRLEVVKSQLRKSLELSAAE